MAYASYVSDINSKSNTITEFTNNTTKIELDSIWQGKASDKQRGNLKSVQTELTTQVNQLSKLNEAMTGIDEYDKLKKDLQEARDQLNSLDNKDDDYAARYSELSERIRKLTEEIKTLKTKIENTLTSITSSYTNQLSKIDKTEIQKTENLLKETEKQLSTINFELKITKAEKTGSQQAGNITLDKQGTYYEKEPTPGKSAQKLHVYHNDQRLYDDAEITIKKGETIRLTVNLSDNAGEIKQLTRTSADGYRSETNPNANWNNYFSAQSEPYVNRYDKSTFVERDNFDWVITGNKTTNGYVTLSQTTFHSTDRGNEFKSMYRIKIRVVE